MLKGFIFAIGSILSGEVTQVIDGDTFIMQTGNGTVNVRLQGVDAPEIKQPFGTHCRDLLTGLIHGGKVELAVTGHSYGRMVAYVRKGSTLVNERVVSDGCAMAEPRYDRQHMFMLMENGARERRDGIWSDPANPPQAPWEFRK